MPIKEKGIQFTTEKFPKENMEYVLWIDIMGIQNSMSVSLQTSANFIGKMHMALLEQKKKGISIYRHKNNTCVRRFNERLPQAI